MNANTHNFKIEHDTAFKLGKHKVERLINCLNKKMENENLKNFFSIGPPLNDFNSLLNMV